MSERQTLMRKLATYFFAIFDLHLYLDTHPNDEKAAEKIKNYQAELTPLVEEYQSKYGPLSMDAENGNRWAWIQNPWPWETEGNK